MTDHRTLVTQVNWFRDALYGFCCVKSYPFTHVCTRVVAKVTHTTVVKQTSHLCKVVKKKNNQLGVMIELINLKFIMVCILLSFENNLSSSSFLKHDVV